MLPPYIADIAHRCFNDRGNRQLKHLKQLTTEPVCLLSKYQFEQVHLIVTPTDVTLNRSPLQPSCLLVSTPGGTRESGLPPPRAARLQLSLTHSRFIRLELVLEYEREERKSRLSSIITLTQKILNKDCQKAVTSYDLVQISFQLHIYYFRFIYFRFIPKLHEVIMFTLWPSPWGLWERDLCMCRSTLGENLEPEPELSGNRSFAWDRVLWEGDLGLSQSTLGSMCIPPGAGTRRRRENAVGLGYLGLPAARPAMSDKK